MHERIDSKDVPIKAWTNDVPVEPEARKQLKNIAELPFIHGHIAVMADVNLGKGATVGSVIPTKGAINPAAVGVDDRLRHGGGDDERHRFAPAEFAQGHSRFTLEDQIAAHVECRKDAGVIDETPMAYEDIDAVMAAQSDLVEVVQTLRQIVCVKG